MGHVEVTKTTRCNYILSISDDNDEYYELLIMDIEEMREVIKVLTEIVNEMELHNERD